MVLYLGYLYFIFFMPSFVQTSLSLTGCRRPFFTSMSMILIATSLLTLILQDASDLFRASLLHRMSMFMVLSKSG